MSHKHNKSGLTSLSILQLNDDQLAECEESLKGANPVQIGRGVLLGCIQHRSRDGRISLKGKKVCYGYELIALRKFGKKELQKVPPNKLSNSLTISHICGTRNCCNSQHLVLEAKVINDERVHCHYCIKNAYLAGGPKAVALFKSIGCCPHKPICLYLWRQKVGDKHRLYTCKLRETPKALLTAVLKKFKTQQMVNGHRMVITAKMRLRSPS